jgi:vancomycin resistance protein YoaR
MPMSIIPSPKIRPQSKTKKNIGYFLTGGLMTAVLLPIMLMAGYFLMYQGKAYPGVKINGKPFSGMDRSQIKQTLERQISEYQATWPLKLTYGQYQWVIPYPQEKIKWNIDNTTNEALAMGRQGSIWEQIRTPVRLWSQPINLAIQTLIEPHYLESMAASMAATLNKEAIPPSITVSNNQKLPKQKVVTVSMGEIGQVFDQAGFVTQSQKLTSQLLPWQIEPYINKVDVRATTMEVEKAKVRAKAMLQKTLTIRDSSQSGQLTWTLTGDDLVGFINVKSGYKQDSLLSYLAGVSEVVDRPPQNAKFSFDDTSQKVQEFSPALDGLEVVVSESAKQITTELEKLEASGSAAMVDLVVTNTPPAISLANVNDLGIKELIGKGESTYFHSIVTRVHNVSLAASRINGTLVKPGENFSFNQAVGDISAATGYQQAYIIRAGKTELGDGGGVCQDSTTVFRAALNAGLPITERHAHAYRVGYYEQDTKAGIDATVYSPAPDLKFLNDTPGYILINTVVDEPNRHLTVNIYGTSDGRKSEIFNHVVWGITPPLPDVYVDDPTLPNGEIKQVDFKAAGAKAKFSYRVTRGEEIIFEKTFMSDYKPWASVFLRGTK